MKNANELGVAKLISDFEEELNDFAIEEKEEGELVIKGLENMISDLKNRIKDWK